MPRYFFDVAGDPPDLDDAGMDYLDDDTARDVATRFLGELLLHEPHRLAGGNLRVVIRTGGMRVSEIAATRAVSGAA